MGGADSPPARSRWVLFVVLLTACAAGQAKAYQFEDGVFLGAAELLPDWADMLSRRADELPEFHNCLSSKDLCNRRYLGVRHLLEKAQTLSEARQIRLINRYVNKRRYRDDRNATLTTELSTQPLTYRSRWSTPGEFFIRGGDCEDFATTKYFLLRELGIESSRMRVVVTWDRRARGYHAILAVRFDDGGVWLLESDNQILKRRHQDYRYIYAVNENAVWDHEVPAEAAVSTDATAITKPMEATL
jgi:predicted transglutaminase-like cysteine proteinase